MKIAIDRNLCISTGMCTSIAPANFELDDDGILVIVEDFDSDMLDTIESAVVCCPMGAISIEGR